MKRLLPFVFILAVSFASAAQAAVITFSEVGATNASFLSSDGTVLAEWVWTTGLADGHNHINNVGGNPGDFEQGHGQEFQGLRFSNVGGGAITLVSFDMKGNWNVGALNDGGGTAYASPLGGAWVTQVSGLTANPYVYIFAPGDGGGGIVGPSGYLDNVVLNVVPEPVTLLLLGGGLAAAGVRRYRGQRA